MNGVNLIANSCGDKSEDDFAVKGLSFERYKIGRTCSDSSLIPDGQSHYTAKFTELVQEASAEILKKYMAFLIFASPLLDGSFRTNL